LGRIGADHHDHFGVLALVEGRGHRAGADALHQRRYRRGVTKPRAVIHVVGAEAGAHELLEEISLLVGAFGRAESCKRLRAVAVADRLEPRGGAIERLLPCRGAEMRPRISGIDAVVGVLRHAVLTDERWRQAMRMAHVVEAEAPLDAEPVLVRWPVSTADIEQLVVLDV